MNEVQFFYNPDHSQLFLSFCIIYIFSRLGVSQTFLGWKEGFALVRILGQINVLFGSHLDDGAGGRARFEETFV